MRKFKLCFVGNLKTLPYSPDHAGVIQGLERLGIDYFIADPKESGETQESLTEAIISGKPDVIIHGMTDSLSLIIPPKVKERLPKAIQVMSMWDYRSQDMKYDGLWDKWTLSGPALDLITLSNKNQLDWWAEAFGTETMYWPHGCVVKNVEYAEEYNHDAVFVGGRNENEPYVRRVKLIDSINQKTPVKWINAPGSDGTPERIKVWKDLGKIYHSAKVALDVSHFWDADGYASGRYFYTSGLGACAVTKRFPGCEELFPEGTKAYFDTPEEAAHKINFYLANEKERNKIKKAGKEWANKYHTYEARFSELFKYLGIKI